MWGGTGANLKAYIKHIPNTYIKNIFIIYKIVKNKKGFDIRN